MRGCALRWRSGFGLNLLALAGLVVAVARPARRASPSGSTQATRSTGDATQLLHDPLTQLPNATYLLAHLGRLAAAAEREARQTAVLRVDLDNLARCATRWAASGRRDVADDRAAHSASRCAPATSPPISGRTISCWSHPSLDDAHAVTGIAHRVQAALAKPFSLQGGARRIGASIGVTLLGDDLPDAERTLANAEIALAAAQGGSGAATSTISARACAPRPSGARRCSPSCWPGLERGEFAPFFQPQIDLATGELVGLRGAGSLAAPA